MLKCGVWFLVTSSEWRVTSVECGIYSIIVARFHFYYKQVAPTFRRNALRLYNFALGTFHSALITRY